MDIPAIETARLTLRAWKPEDASALFHILQEDGILRYFPDCGPPPPGMADRYIARQMAHWERHGYGHWAVIAREGGQLVGWDGLELLPELDEIEVAYLLSRRVWGRGYATEVARAALQYGFETAGLASVIGLVHPANAASIRVLEKCGMTFADRLTLWGLDMARYRVDRLPRPQGQIREALQPPPGA